MTPELQLILGLLTLAGVIFGAIITGRYAERKARIEATESPYEALMERVTALEKRLTVLEEERDRDRAYIRAVVPWVDEHAHVARRQPPPPPAWLFRGEHHGKDS